MMKKNYFKLIIQQLTFNQIFYSKLNLFKEYLINSKYLFAMKLFKINSNKLKFIKIQKKYHNKLFFKFLSTVQ